MKYFRILFLFCVSCSMLHSTEEIKIGILYEKIFTTKKEAKIGLKLWEKQMKKKNYDYDVNIFLYEDKNKLISDYTNKKIHAIVFDTTSYYENKKEIDTLSSNKWAISRTSSVFQQFYLVKNTESKISLTKFKVDKIFYKENMSRVWLENFLSKRNMNINTEVYEKIEKPNKLVFNIFFNKDNISIMTEDLYESMIDLNPQVKSKLKIIEKSKKMFFHAVGFTRKGMDKNIKKTLYSIEKEINTNNSAWEAVSFTNVQQVFPLKNDDLKELDDFYKEYFSRKNQ